MPWRGLEPRRLSAPPPQDGVSTNFTTRAQPALFVPLVSSTEPTGLEPATSRVTVECSNQTELRLLLATLRRRSIRSRSRKRSLLLPYRPPPLRRRSIRSRSRKRSLLLPYRPPPPRRRSIRSRSRKRSLLLPYRPPPLRRT